MWTIVVCMLTCACRLSCKKVIETNPFLIFKNVWTAAKKKINELHREEFDQKRDGIKTGKSFGSKHWHQHLNDCWTLVQKLTVEKRRKFSWSRNTFTVPENFDKININFFFLSINRILSFNLFPEGLLYDTMNVTYRFSIYCEGDTERAPILCRVRQVQ